MLADLHIHTTFSDGVYTPEQIVTQARAAGMGCIAITDHDNIQAYDRAERMIHFRHLGLKLLRGVEMTRITKGRISMYWVTILIPRTRNSCRPCAGTG